MTESRSVLESLTVLSGIRSTQPTLHVGNYFGALRQFLHFQNELPGRCYFFVADLHSIGDVTDPRQMKRNSLSIATEFLAAGLDPNKSTVYIQSAVPELTQLTWLLTAVTNDTELLGLPHYREKRDKYAAKDKDIKGAPSTFLAYPILQAADILFTAGLGERILVPVGEDQRAHIEFTRDVARRYNNTYSPLFGDPVMPEDVGMVVDNEGRGNIRIRGLDGQEKMGKSEGNAIYLESSPEEIEALVRKGVTDPKRQRKTDPGDPNDCIGIYPLHEFVTSKEEREQIAHGCRGGTLSCTECKMALSHNLADLFAEFRERKADFTQRPDCVREIVMDGALTVRRMVKEKLVQMHEQMGLMPYGG